MKSRHSSLIIGRQPLIEAIRAGKSIERIFLQRHSVGENIKLIRDLARQHQIPINLVPEEKLNRINRGGGRVNHQGCIGIGALIRYYDLQDVISIVVEKGEVPLFLMVDGVTDVRNIGAMARSALCSGAQALILPEKGVASLNEEAIKTSAGALEHLYVCRVQQLKEAIHLLHLNGFCVMASDSKGEKLVYECNWSLPAAVLMGSEDKGIQNELMRDADTVFRIPMAGNFDSFNVAVATGIILYEALKQRLDPQQNSK